MMLLSELKFPFPGMFRKCLKIPVLQSGKAEKYADILMKRLDTEKSIDIYTPPDNRNPLLSTDYLFSDARGQMFGILVCINRKGEKVILKAFSGQYNSQWTVPGWTPPVIDPDDFDNIVREKDKEIKKLDREIEKLESVLKIAAGDNQTGKTDREVEKDNSSDLSSVAPAEFSSNSGHAAEETGKAVSEKITKLKEERKKISQNLMKEIHSLYYLHNFEGDKKEMGTVFKKEASRAADVSPEHGSRKASPFEDAPVQIQPDMLSDRKEASSGSEEPGGHPTPFGRLAEKKEAPRADVLGPPVPAIPGNKKEAPSASEEACGPPVPLGRLAEKKEAPSASEEACRSPVPHGMPLENKEAPGNIVPGLPVPAMPGNKKEAPSASEEACGPPVPLGMPLENKEAPGTIIPGPPVPAMPRDKKEAPRTDVLGPPVPAMPAGTGDCCAPKLLNYAAKEKLIPLSMIEFYYGKENRSGSKIHKRFYPPCKDKCGPIMDYLLTGIKELHKKYSDLIKSADI